MANKRNLKKYMKTMAANLAGETLFILNYYENIDEAKADAIIDKQCFCFIDKTCKVSFEGNRKDYRKAHAAYFKKCYNELADEFNNGVQAILKEMNGLLSKEQLEENKRMANA